MIILFYACMGVAAGFLGGLFGIGGGLIVVPSLVIAFHLLHFPDTYSMHTAIGTSLAAMLFTSASSAWAHCQQKGVLMGFRAYSDSWSYYRGCFRSPLCRLSFKPPPDAYFWNLCHDHWRHFFTALQTNNSEELPAPFSCHERLWNLYRRPLLPFRNWRRDPDCSYFNRPERAIKKRHRHFCLPRFLHRPVRSPLLPLPGMATAERWRRYRLYLPACVYLHRFDRLSRCTLRGKVHLYLSYNSSESFLVSS